MMPFAAGEAGGHIGSPQRQLWVGEEKREKPANAGDIT
jgi:hypothetical protein